MTFKKYKIFNNNFFWFFLLFTFFILIQIDFYNHGALSDDLAEYIQNPLRIINGQIPYKDFWLLFPPGEVYVPALVYKIFGLQIKSILLFNVFIKSLVSSAVFILMKLICKKNIYAAVSAILFFFMGDLQIYMFFLLFSFLFIYEYLFTENRFWLFMAGSFVGVAFNFRFFLTGAFAFSVITLLVLKIGKIKLLLQNILTFILGTFLIFTFNFWLYKKFFFAMIQETVLKGLKHGTTMDINYIDQIFISLDILKKSFSTLLNQFGIMNSWSFMVFFFEFILTVCLYALPFLAILIAIYLLFFKKRNFIKKEIIYLLLIWGTLVFLKSIRKPDPEHLVYANSIFLLLFIYIFSKLKTSKLKSLMNIVIIIFLMRLYVFAFHYYFNFRIPQYNVTAKFGTLQVSNEYEAKKLQSVIRFIEQNSSRNDYILNTLFYSPPFYAMTGRKNATYYDSLIDLFTNKNFQKEKMICNQILNSNTKLVIHNPKWKFGDRGEFDQQLPILQKCIDQNFVLKEKNDEYWLYKKMS
ncbi:hypothetical protein GYA49_04705 [Candidatus Beckwithbacteria bacterium]|nr:hypothetical protein [Candidatus Beckwithbacteria bacterium]